MQSKFLEVEPRSFSPLSIPGLSDKAQYAVNAALDAMSTWRNEIADASETNGQQVIEKMAAAAKALGWPEQVVDTVRTQIQSVAAIQIKTMDQIMEVWEEQLKLPNPATAPTTNMLSRMQSPSIIPAGNWPGSGSFPAMNPAQVWLQFMEQWQKSWAEAMTTLTKTGKSQ
ncbi:MAG: hypothetical protein K2Z80_03575 [Xanthobacteraceae bacterium]|nr:hypothetical protein [Xanthobacteraceae bacterium]